MVALWLGLERLQHSDYPSWKDCFTEKREYVSLIQPPFLSLSLYIYIYIAFRVRSQLSFIAEQIYSFSKNILNPFLCLNFLISLSSKKHITKNNNQTLSLTLIRYLALELWSWLLRESWQLSATPCWPKYVSLSSAFPSVPFCWVFLLILFVEYSFSFYLLSIPSHFICWVFLLILGVGIPVIPLSVLSNSF